MTTIKRIILLMAVLAFQQESFGQAGASDTTFILRDISGDVYHAIYIENDKKSRYYDLITDFTFRQDYSFYNYTIKEIFKDNSPKFNGQKISTALPRTWCGLNSYNDKFYLYAASNWTRFRNLILTDTTIIQFSLEGPYASKIEGLKTIDKNTFEFLHRTHGGIQKKLTIHIIDWENQIAVFDNHAERDDFRYSLKVGSSKARQFPIVVNYCAQSRKLEFVFDNVDLKKLLTQKQ